MHVFSVVMDSRHYVANFQPLFVARIAKFQIKKDSEKFDDF